MTKRIALAAEVVLTRIVLAAILALLIIVAPATAEVAITQGPMDALDFLAGTLGELVLALVTS